jgi:ribonucleoside-diphosphate reductase alpha chain
MSKWERPERLNGFTIKMKTGLGNIYITVNEQEGRPVEIFAIVGKSGQSLMAKTEAIGRLISLNLQNGVPVAEIIKQLKGIAGGSPLADKGGLILSIPDAIAKILESEYVKKEVS